MTEVKRASSVQQFEQRCLESDHKCICQICTCGKHRCPQPHVPFKGETTNHHDYKAYNVAVERPHRCAYKLADSHYDPDLIKSTYRVNYKPYRCAASPNYKKYAYEPNNAKFYGDTEYNTKYIPNKITVQGPTPCQNQYQPSKSRFQGKTTYNTEFKAKKNDHQTPKKHYAYQQNTLPFYGNTTYGETFQPYKIETQRPQTACHGKYTGNTARFQGKSTYQDYYHAHHIDRGCRCFIEQLPPRPRQCSPGKNHVHFQARQCKWN